MKQKVIKKIESMADLPDTKLTKVREIWVIQALLLGLL